MGSLILALLERSKQAAEVVDCLSASGYAVCVVGSFAKAQAVLWKQPADLIISDVHLENGGSVFDFLKWVKNQPLLQATPFVLLCLEPSSRAKYLSDGVGVAARYLGAAKCITMDSFDPVALSAEIGLLLPPTPLTPVTSYEKIGVYSGGEDPSID